MPFVPEPAGQDPRRPFGERLRALRQARGVSLEDFSFEVRRHATAAGGTFSHIGKLERGSLHPTPAMIEALAAALELDPREFPEYRLAQARRELDERAVGLGQALENLERFAPDPAQEEAEAVRDFLAAYDELQESAAAPRARGGKAATARRRRAAS